MSGSAISWESWAQSLAADPDRRLAELQRDLHCFGLAHDTRVAELIRRTHMAIAQGDHQAAEELLDLLGRIERALGR